MVDFEQAWKDLKKYIERERDFYKKGVMCSVDESINGTNVCNDILKEIKKIESK